MRVFNIHYRLFSENPYVRLLSDSNVSATVGTIQEIEYVIAINSDGSKLQQSLLLNMVTFSFNNLVNATMLHLTESREEFQHYFYTSPPLDNSSTGEYILSYGEELIEVLHL